MVTFTQKEKKAMLILFKEYTTFYNAHTLSKLLRITHAGTQKMLKRMEEKNLLIPKTIGKSIVYKLHTDDDYTRSTLTYLLADEANMRQRWKHEFQELYKEKRIIILFGSILLHPKDARDIDLLIILPKEDYRTVKKAIDKRQQILPKPIHSIEMTPEDFFTNLSKKDERFIDIVRTGIVLYGQQDYVEVMKHFTGF